jgi:peptidase YpeB-like protein
MEVPMIKIRRASAIAAGAVAALAIGGTAALAAGADDPAPSRSSDDGFSVPTAPDGDPLPTATTDDPAPTPSSSSSLATVPPARSALSISIDRAKSIAVRVAGGGRVVKVEEESEHGRAVWEVDVDVRGVRHDIDVDRATGAVIRQRIEGAASVAGRAGDDDPANHDAGDDHGGDRGSGGGHGSDG